MAIIVPLVLSLLLESELAEPSCDALSSTPVECGEMQSKLPHSNESDHPTKQPTRSQGVDIGLGAGPYIPRQIFAGMPQEYQGQIQPLRAFAAAINGRPLATD